MSLKKRSIRLQLKSLNIEDLQQKSMILWMAIKHVTPESDHYETIHCEWKELNREIKLRSGIDSFADSEKNAASIDPIWLNEFTEKKNISREIEVYKQAWDHKVIQPPLSIDLSLIETAPKKT